MEYIGFVLCIAVCTFVGYCIGKYNRKYPRNKVVIDLDTFEYLRERDEELWEIEKADRRDNNNVTPYSTKHKQIIVSKKDSVTQ